MNKHTHKAISHLVEFDATLSACILFFFFTPDSFYLIVIKYLYQMKMKKTKKKANVAENTNKIKSNKENRARMSRDEKTKQNKTCTQTANK